MKKQDNSPGDALALAKAVANLLRLAGTDLSDASLLSTGRNPGNAPLLAGQAFQRLVLAVIATERGWPPPLPIGELTLIPDANPLKAGLADLAKSQATLQLQHGVLPDGNAQPAPDREVIRTGLATLSALLKDLASRFGVDLSGEKPAGHPSAIRPAPAPQPAKPTRMAKSSVVTAPRPDPHEVEGRAPIQSRTSSNSTASTGFWALMDEWHIGDREALDLIGHPGGLTKKGTRPRFKLTSEEAGMFNGLREIDAALTLLNLDPQAWLDQPIKNAPFSGATPMEYLVRSQRTGVRETIKFILQHGLKLSMSAGPPARGSNNAAA